MDFLSGAPAPFLPAAGEPAIPWVRWTGIFSNYLEAIGGTEFPVARRRAILLTCLGAEGQRIYETLPAAVKREGEDDFKFAQRRLSEFFSPRVNVCAERYRFRCRAQQPGEPVLQWVAALRQLATTCDYMERTEEFLRDQLIEKTCSPKLRQRLLMEGSALTLDKSLTIAETLESSEREAQAMERPVVFPGAGAASQVPVQAVHQQQRPKQSRQGRRGGRPSGPPLQQRQQPQRQQQQPTAGGVVVCWGCGRQGHRRGDPGCPALGAQCRKCGGTNHFAQHCRPPPQGKRVVSSVEVLAMGESPLKIEALVEGTPVTMTVDSGSPVSLLPRGMVRGELVQADKNLCTYGGHSLRVLGMKCVSVCCNGVTADMCVYVVQEGRALMGLDAMRVFNVNIVGNRVCAVSAGSTTMSSPTPALPDSADLPAVPSRSASPETSLSSALPEQPAILGYQHRVTVDKTVPPVRQPLRRLPLSVVDEVSKRLDQLEQQGVIEPVSASNWVSPLVVGRKRDGRVRLCVDMRRVNKAVVTDGYPLPRIDDVLDRLSGSRVFSRLDLTDAYHQLELHPDSRELTTFVSHKGLFRFRRVNFGLASAGPCFQRVMESMLRGIPGVEIYLDDVLVHARSQGEHDDRLHEVLRRFEAHLVRVNWTKSVTRQKVIPFLGYTVSAEGVHIDWDRIRPLLEAPEPRTEKELRAFLGALGYHARFLPRFSDAVEPLRAALRAERFVWTEALSSAVQSVKDAIRAAPALAMFDSSFPTVLTTDASDVGCGACITQTDALGRTRVVSYGSKTFSAAERNYSVVEREALACVWAVEKYRHYLWGRRFTLRTDHQALCTIFGPKGSTRVGRRVARWEARLLEYSFDVEYVRSADNGVADGLSRLPVADTWWPDDDDVQIATLTVAAAISEEEFRSVSETDEGLRAVRRYLAGRWPAVSGMSTRWRLVSTTSGTSCLSTARSCSGVSVWSSRRRCASACCATRTRATRGWSAPSNGCEPSFGGRALTVKCETC